MFRVRTLGALLSITALSACAGAGNSAQPIGSKGIVPSGLTVAPFLPSRDASSLRTVTLPNDAASLAGLGVGRTRFGASSRTVQSTIPLGDVAFNFGDITPATSTATFAVMTAYTTAQYSLPYPPSGRQTAPARPVERFFGPEIEPGPSCLTEGILYANFGPGGTQRNGPGDPLEFKVGPYNAFRILDLCNVPKNQPATFYLTPIDAAFVSNYVRPNAYGLPSIAGEVYSPEPPGTADAQWYALLYNFAAGRWDIVLRTHGSAPGFPGDVISYPGSENLPETCPALPPLMATEIAVYDPTNGHFRKAGPDNSYRVLPGATNDPFYPPGTTTSTACFVADSSGPASLSYSFLRAEQNSDWVLKAVTTGP